MAKKKGVAPHKEWGRNENDDRVGCVTIRTEQEVKTSAPPGDNAQKRDQLYINISHLPAKQWGAELR